MTKREIVRQIAEELNVDQGLVKTVVQRTMDGILDALIEDGRIELRNFGVFEIKHRAARKARNPKTNQEVIVPARKTITFQAGKNVTARLRGKGARS